MKCHDDQILGQLFTSLFTHFLLASLFNGVRKCSKFGSVLDPNTLAPNGPTILPAYFGSWTWTRADVQCCCFLASNEMLILCFYSAEPTLSRHRADIARAVSHSAESKISLWSMIGETPEAFLTWQNHFCLSAEFMATTVPANLLIMLRVIYRNSKRSVSLVLAW